MKWTRVKNFKPPINMPILCYCKIYGIYTGVLSDVNGFPQWFDQINGDILPPTHWMPLPDAPK